VILWALLACGPSHDVDEVSFLLGHWEARDNRGWTQERWVRNGDGLDGAGRFTAPGATQATLEGLSIDVEGGNLVYHSSQAEGVAFPMTAVSATSVTFANPSHTFPQQITYQLDGEHLVATLSGTSAARTGEQVWTFSREEGSAK
jgi:hypothetical protein